MKKTLAALGVVALFATGCASASNPADLKSVHYEGGSFSAKKFKDCLDPSSRSGYDPGDKFYAYPTRQIVYNASQDKGSERGRFSVVSQDNAELYVPAQLTFKLDTDCEVLRKFHETVGSRYNAYIEGSDKTSADYPSGWVDLLNDVIGKPLDQVLDRVAQQYNWRDVWNNPEVKTEMESEVSKNIENLVNRQAGGDFFKDFTVLLSKPDPKDPALVAAIAQEQAGIAEANATKAKAEADAQAATAKANADLVTAKAQKALAQAQADAKQAEIQGYGGIENYLRHELIAAGGNPYQPTWVYGAGGTKQ